MNEITEFLPPYRKPRIVKPKGIVDHTWKPRYQEVYNAWQVANYPEAVKVGGHIKPDWPKVNTANGLTLFVTKFLKYAGWRATRINVQGRLVNGTQQMESGVVLGVKKWQHGTTRRGTADVSSTIKGRSVMFEIKIGNDKPSEFQLREQELERKAGGEYFFIKNPQEFYECYDKIINYGN